MTGSKCGSFTKTAIQFRSGKLVFSSSEADRDIHAAYDNHANGYITKPGSVELLAIVEAIEQFWVAVAHLPKATRQRSASEKLRSAERTGFQ
jgi:DNA-binding NarL/FixJ family response regulator